MHLGRIAFGLYLDLVDQARDGGDVVNALIETAVYEANFGGRVEACMRSGILDALAAPATADLARPVSVLSIASTLQAPFETVRRRVMALAKDGRLVRGRDGVRIAPAWLSRPEAAEQSRLRHERLQRVHRDILEHLGPDAVRLPASREPSRPLLQLSDHLANAYLLRLAVALTSEYGDPLTGFLLLHIIRANIRHLPLEGPDSDDQVLPAQGSPARTAPLAQVIGLSGETVRRRLRSLEKAGFLVREENAVLFDDRVLRGPQGFALIEDAVANLQRLLGQMARTGLL